jgi:hypothetical protein
MADFSAITTTQTTREHRLRKNFSVGSPRRAHREIFSWLSFARGWGRIIQVKFCPFLNHPHHHHTNHSTTESTEVMKRKEREEDVEEVEHEKRGKKDTPHYIENSPLMKELGKLSDHLFSKISPSKNAIPLLILADVMGEAEKVLEEKYELGLEKMDLGYDYQYRKAQGEKLRAKLDAEKEKRLSGTAKFLKFMDEKKEHPPSFPEETVLADAWKDALHEAERIYMVHVHQDV